MNNIDKRHKHFLVSMCKLGNSFGSICQSIPLIIATFQTLIKLRLGVMTISYKEYN
jgi:hypothetical protein